MGAHISVITYIILATEDRCDMGINLMADLGFDENAADVKKARGAATMYADVIDGLVACRNKLGITQKQVAKLMGTTQSAVSDFESVNSDARFSTLIRYAQAVDCDMVIELAPHARFEPNARIERPQRFTWVELKMAPVGNVIPFEPRRYKHNPDRLEALSSSSMFEVEAVAQ